MKATPFRWVVSLVLVAIFASVVACAHRKLESGKSRYQQARAAQEAGDDLQAVLHWKQLVKETTTRIEAGQSGPTDYFLRASSSFELGRWDAGFEDLKRVSPEGLDKDEFWIYPLYLVLMGDYYSRKELHSVADDFYQSVLKKSSLKTSPIFILALERHVNNSIRSIDRKAKQNSDPDKYRAKQYGDLLKDVEKYAEDFPFSSVSHFLLADLLAKTGHAEESMEHVLAALEMGLPTYDLKRSAEFQVVSLLSENQIPQHLKSALLSRAIEWWSGKGESQSILTAGENTKEWLDRQNGQSAQPGDVQTRIRYLAVHTQGKLKILAWEKL